MTRFAVLSDVHGNLEALQAVVEDISRAKVDALMCAGDLVGYGASPNECVRLLADLGALCVAGNHDLMALQEMSESGAGDLARSSLAWTRDTMTRETRSYLGGLPRRLQVDDILMAHGSPGDPREYVRSRRRATQLLADLGTGNNRVLVLGHTHQPWAYGLRQGTLLAGDQGSVGLHPGRPYLLNPGSVGQSRVRSLHARYLVLDTERGGATFRSIPYDVAGSAAALRRAGLPTNSYQLLPRRRRQAYERVSHHVATSWRATRALSGDRTDVAVDPEW